MEFVMAMPGADILDIIEASRAAEQGSVDTISEEIIPVEIIPDDTAREDQNYQFFQRLMNVIVVMLDGESHLLIFIKQTPAQQILPKQILPKTLIQHELNCIERILAVWLKLALETFDVKTNLKFKNIDRI